MAKVISGSGAGAPNNKNNKPKKAPKQKPVAAAPSGGGGPKVINMGGKAPKKSKPVKEKQARQPKTKQPKQKGPSLNRNMNLKPNKSSGGGGGGSAKSVGVVVLVLICLVAFAKFGVLDVMSNSDKAVSDYEAAEASFTAFSSRLASYNNMKSEYSLYAPQPEEREALNCFTLIDIIDSSIRRVAPIKSMTFDKTNLQVSFDISSMDDVSRVVSALKSSPYVDKIQVNDATWSGNGGTSLTARLSIDFIPEPEDAPAVQSDSGTTVTDNWVPQDTMTTDPTAMDPNAVYPPVDGTVDGNMTVPNGDANSVYPQTDAAQTVVPEVNIIDGGDGTQETPEPDDTDSIEAGVDIQ